MNEVIAAEDDGAISARSVLTRKSLKSDEVVFEKERARRVLGQLMHEFLASGLEIASNAPQWKYRPRDMKIGSKEHCIWLWSAASTDLRSESEFVYRAHRMMWEEEQDQFVFGDIPRPTRELYQKKVLGWKESDFESALANRRFGNPHRNVEWWGRRAKTLWHDWKGDPFRMYESGTIDAVMAWKDAQKEDPIPGIGPKIASLIAIFFEEIGMKPVPDAFPVDVHVQRFALALGLVSLKRIDPILNETLEQILRPALSELCREEGWSRIALSHAIWFRGNRGCTNCSRTRHVELSCPVYAECGGVLASKSYFRMGLWLPEAGPLPKGGTAKFISFEDKPLFSGNGA